MINVTLVERPRFLNTCITTSDLTNDSLTTKSSLTTLLTDFFQPRRLYIKSTTIRASHLFIKFFDNAYIEY